MPVRFWDELTGHNLNTADVHCSPLTMETRVPALLVKDTTGYDSGILDLKRVLEDSLARWRLLLPGSSSVGWQALVLGSLSLSVSE